MLGDEEHLELPEHHRENASRTGTCPAQYQCVVPPVTHTAVVCFAREVEHPEPYFPADPVGHMFH